MIARMSKYNFVLFAAQSEDFVEKLRGLGLVDITTAGWEPSEEDRQLLLDIESLAKAAEFLKNFRAGERCDAAAAPFASGEEAYAHYAAAHREAAQYEDDNVGVEAANRTTQAAEGGARYAAKLSTRPRHEVKPEPHGAKQQQKRGIKDAYTKARQGKSTTTATAKGVEGFPFDLNQTVLPLYNVTYTK